ncbi:MAG: 2-C-methyl-D-erythritol 4-phosphate cytidylyltransferase [Chloroflexi bacterium]|nr:2-C-methyl-D-erythritol 4-phosphate cytidylyltransferase [Chloroflexota bacterium]
MAEGVGAIIVAAGEGKRLGGRKAFVPLQGQPLLAYGIRLFEECSEIDQIVVVLHPDDLDQGHRLVAELGCRKLKAICAGGQHRHESVSTGLAQIGPCAWILIHDGARPLATEELIVQGLREAQRTGAAVPVVPVVDTVKVVDRTGNVVGTPPRQSIWAVQTPQVFRSDLIREAYEYAHEAATDDATLVEEQGHVVRVYLGSPQNIKITNRDDLVIAEAILRSRGASASLPTSGKP